MITIKPLLNKCSTCPEFQKMQPKKRLINNEIPGRPYEVVGTNMFSLYNKNDHCVIDYDSKFPILRNMEGLPAYNQILIVEVNFQNMDYT